MARPREVVLLRQPRKTLRPKERLLPFPVCGISAEHVIVGQEVLVAEVLRGLRVGLYCFRVGTFLAVWKRYPYVHN
jgi:hypothetical protein